MFKSVSAAVATLVIPGCATPTAVSDAARAELAPAGKLRAGMNLSNGLFTTRDAATGELRGVSVDLMRELALRIGVPLVLVVHGTPGDGRMRRRRGLGTSRSSQLNRRVRNTSPFRPR